MSATFLGTIAPKVPYIIGIAGSVAVGKSTFARNLQALLAQWPDHPKVDLITTDGFLYPNRVLDARGIMNRKGFPESYDTRALLDGGGEPAEDLLHNLELTQRLLEQQEQAHAGAVGQQPQVLGSQLQIHGRSIYLFIAIGRYISS